MYYVPLYMIISYYMWFIFCLDTLNEGRSKVREAKAACIIVVAKEFIEGVKAEGVASMIKQVNFRD